MRRTLPALGIATVLGILLAFAPSSVASLDSHEVQKSTDGGETWTTLTSSGSATGFSYLGAFDSSGEKWFGIANTDDDTIDGDVTTLWRVRESEVPAADQGTFNTTYGTGNSITMSWDENGHYSEVE